MKSLLSFTLITCCLMSSSFAGQAKFKHGAWAALIYQHQELIGGADFTVSKSGQISGNSVYNSGKIYSVKGRIDRNGEFKVSQNTPSFDRVSTGKVSGDGKVIRLKTVGGYLIVGGAITQSKVPQIYTGDTRLGRVFFAVEKMASGGKRVTVLLENKEVVRAILSGTRFKARLKEGEISGQVRDSRVTGTLKKGKFQVDFTAAHL